MVRIQLKKMCHLADESMTIKADFSAEPDSKIDAEGFPRFWVFFLSRSRLLHIRNRIFLNARPKILLLFSQSFMMQLPPSLFSCHYVSKDYTPQGIPWTSPDSTIS